jgi:hypothetical protein
MDRLGHGAATLDDEAASKTLAGVGDTRVFSSARSAIRWAGQVTPQIRIHHGQWRAASLPGLGWQERDYPPELFPTNADGESLDNWRRWYRRMNSGWSEAVEASARVNFTLADPEKRARALGLMIENEARPDHTKIQSPALMITVINPSANAVKQLTGLTGSMLNDVQTLSGESQGSVFQAVLCDLIYWVVGPTSRFSSGCQ